jgi:hypothetical protein
MIITLQLNWLVTKENVTVLILRYPIVIIDRKLIVRSFVNASTHKSRTGVLTSPSFLSIQFKHIKWFKMTKINAKLTL